jgi:hypothetical protein
MYTNCFNLKQLYIFPIQYIYVFRMILTMNSDYFHNSIVTEYV